MIRKLEDPKEFIEIYNQNLKMRLKFETPDSYHADAKVAMADIFRLLNKNNGVEKQDFPALNLLAYSYHIYFQSRDILLRDGIMIEDQQQTNQPCQT